MPSLLDTHWENLIRDSIETPEAFSSSFGFSVAEFQDVIRAYPARVNPYYLKLVKKFGDPLFFQVVPSKDELVALPGIVADGLCEKEQSPVPGLVHRYPDRVLLAPTSNCALFCRHCMRKRDLGKKSSFDEKAVLFYISEHEEVREVILSGGDPLMFSDERLSDLLAKIRAIPHVKILRIHTRMPCTLPQRVTPELCKMLKAFQPLVMNIHFNHPAELTEESRRACGLLSEAGIPMGSQTVLLKGVNDDPEILASLFQKLFSIGVRPYYLHHPDPVAGIYPFRMDLERGIKIYQRLQNFISETHAPSYMIDLPGGGGKVSLSGDFPCAPDENGWISVRNFEGKTFYYPAKAWPSGPAPKC